MYVFVYINKYVHNTYNTLYVYLFHLYLCLYVYGALNACVPYVRPEYSVRGTPVIVSERHLFAIAHGYRVQ